MKPFTQAVMLTDGNGNLIPQHYDPITDTFKPGSYTQLTGSLMALAGQPKPQGQEGNTLLEYNEITGETKVYKFIVGDWREL